MRFLGWNSVLSGWLVVSAFALPQTAISAGAAVIAGFLTLSLAAFAVGRPWVRYAIALVAMALAGVALFGALPGIAAVNDALVAAALFALSLVSPQHHAHEPAAVAHGK